ncbi:MAG: TetR family transcriptional regulator [Mycobacterium sp.]|nr:TetR family transcriptional regulator [Mycobacterium sp.]
MSGQVPDPTTSKILDAACGVLGEFGFKHATIELVAKSAGVSHMTIYRRWPTKGELLTTALLREFATALSAAFDGVDKSDSFDEKLVGAFIEMVQAVRDNPVIAAAFAADAETSSQRGVENFGSVMMGSAAPLVADHIGSIADFELDSADVAVLADVFLRLTHSLLVLDYPGQPVSGPADVASYALSTVGPLARSVEDLFGGLRVVDSGSHAGDAAVAVATRNRRLFGSNRRSGTGAPRSKVMLGAASLLSVLVVSSALTVAVLHPGRAQVGPVDISRTEGSQPAVDSPEPAPLRLPAPDGVRLSIEPAVPDPDLEQPAQFGESADPDTPTQDVPTADDADTPRSGAGGGADRPNVPFRPPPLDRRFEPDAGQPDGEPDGGPQSGPMPRPPRAGVPGPGPGPGPARPPQPRPRPEGSGGTGPR